MAQLTIYIDDETRARVEAAARMADVSISQWVKDRLIGALETRWPENYFDLFGKLADSDLERPRQPDPARDAPRKRL